jgi:hypothetical protein
MVDHVGVSMNERVDRLDRMIAEGRVIRHKWTDKDAAGRELACLLVAISPEVGPRGDTRNCPSSVMPPWLALLTPILDDRGSVGAWPGMVRRYASLARRWHVLDEAGWLRARNGACAAIAREAMRHTKRPDVIAVCREVAGLREQRGERPLQLSAARARAEGLRLMLLANEVEASSAWTAKKVADGDVVGAAATVEIAAGAGAGDGAHPCEWVNERQQAREAANDRVATGVFDAIEAALGTP